MTAFLIRVYTDRLCHQLQLHMVMDFDGKMEYLKNYLYIHVQQKAGQGVGVSHNWWGLNILKYIPVMELWWPVA